MVALNCQTPADQMSQGLYCQKYEEINSFYLNFILFILQFFLYRKIYVNQSRKILAEWTLWLCFEVRSEDGGHIHIDHLGNSWHLANIRQFLI